MPKSELRRATKLVGQCAKHAATKASSRSAQVAAEIQIGLGTCCDGLAWASRLRALDFDTAVKRNNKRAEAHLEATRFVYAWTAANAIFSRDDLLRVLKPKLPNGGELPRFRLLVSAASLTTAEVGRFLPQLHATLALPRAPKDFPWTSRGALRLIDVIHYKYTPMYYRTCSETARKINGIVSSNSPVTTLDLPEILYSARNWLVHGALLDSSFRGSPANFISFMTTLTEAAALILGRAATAIQASL